MHKVTSIPQVFVLFYFCNNLFAPKGTHDFLVWTNRLDLNTLHVPLTCIRANNGLSIDLWGTPHKIFESSESKFSKFSENMRLKKLEFNYFTEWFEKPFGNTAWSMAVKLWRFVSTMRIISKVSWICPLS